MQKNTYIFSDTHLDDTPDSLARERELVKWLKSIEPSAKRIIMLGDIFDFWFSYKYVVPRGHTRLIGQLAAMADNGIEIHYFVGNHDMWVFNYFERETGAIMHDNPEVLTIDGKKMLIGHGDGLGVCNGSYPLLKRIFRCRVNQQLFALIPPSLSVPIANAWSRSSRRSHGTKYLTFLGDEKEDLLQYCTKLSKQEQYDYMIFGHRHLAMSRELHNGCLYINVGDWFTHRDYAIISDGQVSIRNLQEQ